MYPSPLPKLRNEGGTLLYIHAAHEEFTLRTIL